MEKLICQRINWWVETNGVLPNEQCGFRRGRSTTDILLQIEHHIQIALKTQEVCLVVFFDLKSAFDTASHLGILYKLAKIGIRGTPLKFIQSYMKNRTYNVCIGNTHSDDFPIVSGVPQGAILSPTLFSILLSDMPYTPDTYSFLYADDISLMARGKDYHTVQRTLQSAVSKLIKWFDSWGLVVNTEKTKLMSFHRRKLPHRPVILSKGKVIPYVKEHKHLGLTFDGPKLTWKTHVENLRLASQRRLDLMKRSCGTKWGAGRDVLLLIYKSYIRSLLDYGSVVYGSAAMTTLKPLDVLQNSALRIALGAFKTSPTVSLHAEANILPLKYWRKTQLCRYYYKIQQLPLDHPLFELFSDQWNIVDNEEWSNLNLPFLVRAKTALLELHLPCEDFTPSPVVSIFPPWEGIDKYIDIQLTNQCSKISPDQCRIQFQNRLHTVYDDYQHIYTDGSHYTDPESTGSALYVDELEMPLSWKLTPTTSIVTAEMFAIYKALVFIGNNLSSKNQVIFTDSLSALQIIRSKRIGKFKFLTHKIQICLKDLTEQDKNVKLCWVPSHVGIDGNEEADKAAKAATNRTQIINTTTEIGDSIQTISRAVEDFWYTYRRVELNGTQLGHIKDGDGPSRWARFKNRKIDCAITRLRIGHTGLNAHLARLNLIESPMCRWCPAIPETVDHLILECQCHEIARNKLRSMLRAKGIRAMTLQTLLDGAGFTPPDRAFILRAVVIFLKSSGQLERL